MAVTDNVGIHPTAAALVQAAAPFSNSLLLAEQPGRKPQFTPSIEPRRTAPSLSQGLPLTLPGNLYGTNFGSYTEGGTSHGGVAFGTFHASGTPGRLRPSTRLTKPRKPVPPSSPLTSTQQESVWRNVLRRSLFHGSVFELSKTGKVWKETILHSFGGPGDGALPYGPLVHRRQATSTAQLSRRIRGAGELLELSRLNLWSVGKNCSNTFVSDRKPPRLIDS